MSNRLRNFSQTVSASLRLLCFLHVERHGVVDRAEMLLYLVVLLVAARFSLDVGLAGWPLDFDPRALAALTFPIMLVLLTGAALGARLHRPRLAVWLTVAYLAPYILMLMLETALPYWLRDERWANLWWQGDEASPGDVPTALWLSAALALGAARAFQLRWLPTLFIALALTAIKLVTVPWSQTPVWYQQEQEYLPPQIPRLMDEGLFYGQTELLHSSLATLAPERPGVHDLYVLSVAGDASQRVFKHEVLTVNGLLAERYQTAGRMVSLINHDDTVGRYPIATRTSIATALRQLGAIMNPNEDVLFLFLTSHGAQNGEFLLNYWPLQMDPLTGDWLRRVLDSTGIRRRVIVVSSCFGGTFIPPLSTPDTLLITAADAQHTSLGCADVDDLTYFGKAFFDQGVRATPSLSQAFALAKRQIAEWEQEIGEPHSNPQFVEGSNVKRWLPPAMR